MDKLLERHGFSSMQNRRVPEPWNDESRFNLDPTEELKDAFTLMNDEQLKFHLLIGGKNTLYAKALLDSRKQRRLDP